MNRQTNFQEIVDIIEFYRFEGMLPGWLTLPVFNLSQLDNEQPVALVEKDGKLMSVYNWATAHAQLHEGLVSATNEDLLFVTKSSSFAFEKVLLRLSAIFFEWLYKLDKSKKSELFMKKIFWRIMKKLNNPKKRLLLSKIAAQRKLLDIK